MPSSRCGLIVGGLALGATSVRQRIGSDSASALHAVEAIGELLQERNMGSDEMRQQLSEYAKAAVTPGVETTFQTQLQSVVKQIEGDFEGRVRGGHILTQDTVHDYFKVVRTTNNAATAAMNVAVGKDRVWFECVTDEKTKREDVEAKAEALAGATSVQVAACQLQQDNRAFAYDATGKNYTLNFGCDHIKGNCNTAISNWRTNVLDKMFTDAEAALTTDENKHAALKKDCDTKTALQAKAQAALDSATSLWSEKREECAAALNKRTIYMCAFGTAAHEKCDAENAFEDLLAETNQVKGTSHSEVDRQNEWTAMSTTKCMLKQVISKGLDAAINSAELDGCTPTINYARDVGTLDRKADFAKIKKANMCTTRDVSFFNGQEWKVPAGDAPKSAEYTQVGFTPSLSASLGNFGFCKDVPAPVDDEKSFRDTARDWFHRVVKHHSGGWTKEMVDWARSVAESLNSAPEGAVPAPAPEGEAAPAPAPEEEAAPAPAPAPFFR